MRFAIELSNIEPLALYSNRGIQSSTVASYDGNKLEGVWFFVAATMLAVTFSFVAGRVLVQHRRKRRNLQMRDHLNRISPDDEPSEVGRW